MQLGPLLRRWLDYSLPERLFLDLVALRMSLPDTVVFPGANHNGLDCDEWLADGVAHLHSLLSRSGRARPLSEAAIVIALRLLEGLWVDPNCQQADATDGLALAAYWLAAAGKRVMLLGKPLGLPALDAGLAGTGLAPVQQLSAFDTNRLDDLTAPVVALSPETLRQYALYSECQPLEGAPAIIAPDYVLVTDGWHYFQQLLVLEALPGNPSNDARAWMQLCFDVGLELPKTLAGQGEASALLCAEDERIALTPLGEQRALARLHASPLRHQHAEPEFLLLVEDALTAQMTYQRGTHYEWTATGLAPLAALKAPIRPSVQHFLALRDAVPPPPHQDILAAVALADVFGAGCHVSGLIPYAAQIREGLTAHLPITVSRLRRAARLHLECRVAEHAHLAPAGRPEATREAATPPLAPHFTFGTLARFALENQTPGVTLSITATSGLFEQMKRCSSKPLYATSPEKHLVAALARHLEQTETRIWQDLKSQMTWHEALRGPLKLISAWRQTWLEIHQRCRRGQGPVTQFDLKAIILEFGLSLDESTAESGSEAEARVLSELGALPPFQRLMTASMTEAEVTAMTLALAAAAVALLDRLRADLLSQSCELILRSALHSYAQQRPLDEFKHQIHTFMRAATQQFKVQILQVLSAPALAPSLPEGSPV